MKKFSEKIISILPYFILVTISGSILVFLYFGNLDYKEYIQILQILIWPSIVLGALLFFRKVFTYLFFSMEEFGFFGNKGKLKNIEEVINEKVEERIKREKEQVDIELKMKKFEGKLQNVTQSKADETKKAEEYRDLAVKMVKQYKEMSDINKELNEELYELRRYKQNRLDRLDRINRIRRGIRESRQEDDTFDKSLDTPKANKEKTERIHIPPRPTP